MPHSCRSILLPLKQDRARFRETDSYRRPRFSNEAYMTYGQCTALIRIKGCARRTPPLRGGSEVAEGTRVNV
jgi:hypothetical protein